MSLTYATACKAVADVFRPYSRVEGNPADDQEFTIGRVQAYDEITESVVDEPLLHVYPQSGAVDARNSNDRTTFGAGIRQTDYVVIVDGYARRRSHLAEDLTAQIALIDAIDAILCSQVQPLFGLEGIKGFRWDWKRVTLAFGNTQAMGGAGTREEYTGCQFTITLFIY